MNHLTVEIEDSFGGLLELAANNDVEAFKRSVDRDPSAIDEVGDWYGRKKVIEQRTPLMVAATYGSVDVLALIISLSSADVNRLCGADKTTALHCAASGGSSNAVEAAKILLSSGADPNIVDADGHRPADVVVVPRKLPNAKTVFEELLGCPSAEEDGLKHQELLAVPEKKEYPIDPSLPDIKNSMYATDEFRMFSFKVRPCSRAYSHDWTECPFVHPGENARRRDPRKYHYSCVPCPDFRKGACRRGDMCEYAHGVFECWLHPAQYRTRLCKDGTSCTRRVCFFAHTGEELRPLYVSTGSAVPSPRTSASPAVDITTMGLVPGSPSSLSALVSPFTPPMSPSANGMSHSSGNCPQPSVPALHLPGSNLQSSRLRSALSARDVQDFETHQLINDLCISRLGSSAGNRASRSKNLDELFSADIASSPRFNCDQGGIFSPSRKIAVPSHSSLLQASLGVSSPGRMSPRSIDPVSPLGSHLSAFALRERQGLRSLSARDLGAGSFFAPGSSWYKWSSPSGTLEWGLDGEELRRSASFDLRLDEPDVSWVHSLVKESASEKSAVLGSSSMVQAGIAGQNEDHDHAAALMAWLEQMQLDQMVA